MRTRRPFGTPMAHRFLQAVALLLTAVALSACGPGAAPPAGTGPSPVGASEADGPSPSAPTGADTEPWRFTDDRGVTVTLPRRPVRIVAQSTAAAALWDLGIRPVAVFGPQRRPDGSKEPEIGNVDLSAVESLGEQWGELDLEKLAALRPDLIVTTMYQPPSLWYIPDEVREKVEAIAPTVAIHVAGRPITEVIDRFEELARALGADLSAPQVAAARQRFEQASASLREAIAAKPGLKAMFAGASLETLWVAVPSWYPDLLYFQQLGLDIVVPEQTDQFYEALSWEQALKYPADLILYDRRSYVVPPEELARKVPTWNQHPAVKAGQVGPWYATAAFSREGFAAIMEELAATIRQARADVVD
nr:MAG: ABC transporter substrate-binding protein [Bacillota bacterium]